MTQLLKLKSFPVEVSEKSWIERFPNRPKIVSEQKQKSLTSSRRRKVRNVETTLLTSAPILSTQRTRSGRIVVHKKFDDEIVGDVEINDVGLTSSEVFMSTNDKDGSFEGRLNDF